MKSWLEVIKILKMKSSTPLGSPKKENVNFVHLHPKTHFKNWITTCALPL
jgi:hypothetical protein